MGREKFRFFSKFTDSRKFSNFSLRPTIDLLKGRPELVQKLLRHYFRARKEKKFIKFISNSRPISKLSKSTFIFLNLDKNCPDKLIGCNSVKSYFNSSCEVSSQLLNSSAPKYDSCNSRQSNRRYTDLRPDIFYSSSTRSFDDGDPRAKTWVISRKRVTAGILRLSQTVSSPMTTSLTFSFPSFVTQLDWVKAAANDHCSSSTYLPSFSSPIFTEDLPDNFFPDPCLAVCECTCELSDDIISFDFPSTLPLTPISPIEGVTPNDLIFFETLNGFTNNDKKASHASTYNEAMDSSKKYLSERLGSLTPTGTPPTLPMTAEGLYHKSFSTTTLPPRIPSASEHLSPTLLVSFGIYGWYPSFDPSKCCDPLKHCPFDTRIPKYHRAHHLFYYPAPPPLDKEAFDALLRFQVPPTTSSPHTDTTMSVSNDFNKLRGFSMLLPPTSLMTIIEPTTSLDHSHMLLGSSIVPLNTACITTVVPSAVRSTLITSSLYNLMVPSIELSNAPSALAFTDSHTWGFSVPDSSKLKILQHLAAYARKGTAPSRASNRLRINSSPPLPLRDFSLSANVRMKPRLPTPQKSLRPPKCSSSNRLPCLGYRCKAPWTPCSAARRRHIRTAALTSDPSSDTQGAIQCGRRPITSSIRRPRPTCTTLMQLPPCAQTKATTTHNPPSLQFSLMTIFTFPHVFIHTPTSHSTPPPQTYPPHDFSFSHDPFDSHPLNFVLYWEYKAG